MTVYRLERYLVPLIISLYVVGLAGETAGEYFVHSTIHPGLWMSATLLTAIGWWLAEREPLSLAVACSLIVGGYAFVLIEGTVMEAIFHSSREAIYQHHFLGAILFSIGIFPIHVGGVPLPHLCALYGSGTSKFDSRKWNSVARCSRRRHYLYLFRRIHACSHQDSHTPIFSGEACRQHEGQASEERQTCIPDHQLPIAHPILEASGSPTASDLIALSFIFRCDIVSA
jgi:hypothetical protein